jgi:hypothetical protein
MFCGPKGMFCGPKGMFWGIRRCGMLRGVRGGARLIC